MNVDQRKRRRRRLRRQAAVLAFLAMALGLAWFFENQATTTVVFVRYADRDGAAAGDNPGLSDSGKARAEELARVLGDVDVVAGVDAIFANQYRLTQETAEPLAHRLRLPVQVVDVNDVDGLLAKILKDYKGKVVLVVTHTEPLPVLIRELHGSKKVPEMGEAEYDNLYIVSIPWYGKVKTLRLKYGPPYVPEAAPSAAPGPAPAPDPAQAPAAQ